MNIRNLIRRIRNSLHLQKELPNEAVLGFLPILESVREEEIPCDEIYSKLDEYVEREVSKKRRRPINATDPRASGYMPGML